MANLPEKTIKAGGIQLSVWSNETPKGIFQSVTIKKSYKDGDVWKESKSFKPTDLVKLQLCINKVLEYLFVKDVITPTVAPGPRVEKGSSFPGE